MKEEAAKVATVGTWVGTAAVAKAAVAREEAVRAAAAAEPLQVGLGAVRGAAETKAVARAAATRAAGYKAVAVELGGLQQAHWGGRRAAAARAAEGTGEVNMADTLEIVREARRCRQRRVARGVAMAVAAGAAVR